MASNDQPIPTDRFLLPGQQFCIGMPWERAALARVAPLPARGLDEAPLPAAREDEPFLQADPFAGAEIGACRVIRRLSQTGAGTLLAWRVDPDEGPTLVVLRKLDLQDLDAHDVQVHADWASGFRHQNLSRVHACEVSDEGIFWVSDFASGATLAEIAFACRKQGKGLPLGLVLATVHEAALALGDLHAPGFPHGLVSDQSVSVAFDGRTRLLDAGLFRCIAKANWQQVLEPMTPYFAPEQLLQGRPPDPKCDVFSLGVVLYEGLAGEKHKRSFEERVKQLSQGTRLPPSTFNLAVSKNLDEVVLKTLSTDRAGRYANATELAKGLAATAGEFMWRADQRAKFVKELFPGRLHKEKLLQGEASTVKLELPPSKRIATQPSLRALPAATPDDLPIDELQAAVEALTSKEYTIDPPPPVLKPLAPAPVKAPPPKSSSLGATLAVFGVTAVVAFVAGSKLWLKPLRSVAPELAESLVPTPKPPPPPAPPPEIEYLYDVTSEPPPILPPRPVVQYAEDLWTKAPAPLPPRAPAVKSTRPKRDRDGDGPKVKKKKGKNEQPLPPWLRGGSKRKGRR